MGGKPCFLPLTPIFYSPIGDIIDNSDLANFKQSASGVYQREFSNGLVLVVPPKLQQAAAVAIPAGYQDPKTKAEVRQIPLNGGEGALLLEELQ